MNGPFFHRDDSVDIAIFQVDKIDPRTAVIELGGHLDDYLGESDFTLFEAIVLGYPPIPMADRPILIGARAEVNATIDMRGTPYVHFMLSTMPRGGFSGGVAILEPGFALGMITQSLLTQDNPAELGYMTAISIEPVYQCLADHKLLPDAQAAMWGDWWNSTSLEFYDPAEQRSTGVRAIAAVAVFDNGRRLALTIRCDTTDEMFQRATEAATRQLSGYNIAEERVRERMRRINLVTTYSEQTIQDTFAAARTVAQVYLTSGLAVTEHGFEPDQRMHP
jgi:hypothetical protein